MAISIAINTYNYARFLPRAIRSALNQVGPAGRNIEVLVIDDGSKDDTASVARQFGGQIKYVYQENQGQAAAINKALELASNDIVCLLDADDYFDPGKVQAICDAFESDRTIGAVLNRFRVADETGRILQQEAPDFLHSGDLARLVRFWRVPGIPTSGISLRRSAIQDLKIPEQDFRICADSFLLAILPITTQVKILDCVLHTYVQHGANYYQASPDRAKVERLMKGRPIIDSYSRAAFGTGYFVYPARIKAAVRARSPKHILLEYSEGVRFLFHTPPPLRLLSSEIAKLHLALVGAYPK